MTEKYNFDSVAERLANIDQEVLKEISRHMADGEKAKPMSEQEKACFDILEDVDHVGSHVNGSITNKHHMPNGNLVAFVLQRCTIMVHYIIPC